MLCYCHHATPIALHPAQASAELGADLQVLSRPARPVPATPTVPVTESLSSRARPSPSTRGSSAAPHPPKLPSTRATTPACPKFDSTALRGRPAVESVGTAAGVQNTPQAGGVTAGSDRTPVSVLAPAHPVGSPPADLQDSAAVTVSPPSQPEDAPAPSSPKVPTLSISKRTLSECKHITTIVTHDFF